VRVCWNQSWARAITSPLADLLAGPGEVGVSGLGSQRDDRRGAAASIAGASTPRRVHQCLITGVVHDPGEAKITIAGLPDVPGAAARVFAAVAAATSTST